MPITPLFLAALLAQAAPAAGAAPTPAVDPDAASGAALLALLHRADPPEADDPDPAGRLAAALAAPPLADELGPVRTTPLPLAFGQLPLPFAYRIVARRQSLDDAGDGTAYSETVVVEAVDGPFAGRRVGVAGQLITMPQGVVSAAQYAAPQIVFRLARRPGATGPAALTLGDRAYVVVEHDAPTGGREAVAAGELVGRLVILAVATPAVAEAPAAPDTSDASGASGASDAPMVHTLPAPAAPTPGALLAALQPDADGLLRVPAKLFDESARAVRGRELITVIGPVHVPVRAPMRLLGMARAVDGHGRTIGAAQAFQLEREHLWWEQVNLRVACAAHAGAAPAADAFEAAMVAGGDIVAARSAGRVGGRDAVRFDGTTGPFGMRKDLGEWLVADDRHAWTLRFARSLGEGIQRDFEASLADASFGCDAGTMFAGVPGVD